MSERAQDPTDPRRPILGRKRRHAGAVALSATIHVGVLLAVLLAVKPAPRRAVDTPVPVPVALIAAARLAPTPAPETPAKAPKVAPEAGKKTPRPAPTPRHVVLQPVEDAEAAGPPPGLTDNELAGAISADAGGGGGGGACDIGRRVQTALRQDALVQAQVAQAHLAEQAGGRPVLVWNGDWIRSSGQDGKGLAAVREAIMWAIAFAPDACKREPVHGYVLLSLTSPGVRLAVGGADWRWSSLLGVGR